MSLRSARPIRPRKGPTPPYDPTASSSSNTLSPQAYANNHSRNHLLSDQSQASRPKPRPPFADFKFPVTPFPTPTSTPDRTSHTCTPGIVRTDTESTATTTSTVQSYKYADRVYQPTGTQECLTIGAVKQALADTHVPSETSEQSGPDHIHIPGLRAIENVLLALTPTPAPHPPSLLPYQKSTGLFPPIAPRPSKVPYTLCAFKVILENILDNHFLIMGTAQKLFAFFPVLHTQANIGHLQRLVEHRFSLGQIPEVDLEEIERMKVKDGVVKDRKLKNIAQEAFRALIGSSDRLVAILSDAEDQVRYMRMKEKEIELEMERKRKKDIEKKLWFGKRWWRKLKRTQNKNKDEVGQAQWGPGPKPKGWGKDYEDKVANMIKTGREVADMRVSIEKFIAIALNQDA